MAQQNLYADYSGITQVTENPYDALLESCANDPALIQERYSTHREKRNAQQKARMLDPEFKSLDIDQVLHKLVHRAEYPGFQDTRNCLVFWARPSQAVKDLIKQIQDKLRIVTPNFWFMPPDNLHMTALEIKHSGTAPEIAALVETLRPKLAEITDYTYDHRSTLVEPIVSFDASAIALSFVPSAENGYTYHHLRKDLFALCQSTGVEVASRYVVPSAHLTIGRFVDHKDVGIPGQDAIDSAKVKAWLSKLEEINNWIRRDYWKYDFQWHVGQEKGLDCNTGTLWYGDGERVRIGKGF